MELKNKTVVITGGSDGLGFSLAKLFISKGSNVCIIGRDKNKLETAVKSLGANAKGYSADVSKLEEIQKVANDIGDVDVLINAAGVWIEGSIADNSGKEISDAIDTNLKGVIFSTKAFLPSLLKSNEAHIINISSTSGLKGRNNQAVYVASKFGVTGFTDSLKEDLANTNIKVSGFYPGGMNTSLFQKAGKPKDNSDWMDTNKVAEVIVFMIERDMTMIMDHVVLNKRNTKTSN
ncbi:MAG: SDR family oxidoreductase [Parachlamydiales bacterium]|jgi:short-subunit dehydrogenase